MRSKSRNHKTAEEIAKMRKAGLLVWEAHQEVATRIRPGVTTGELNEAVEAFLASRNAIPLFKGVPGPTPYPAATCISVNSEVVHGIPGLRKLKEGDIVSIDIGVKFEGWCGDAAVTHPVGKIDPISQQVLDVTEGALRLAIGLVSEKSRWSQVAREMARYVESAGFSVVDDLTGHGIGRQLWEDPRVPNCSSREFERTGDFTLEPGIVIAVEPMVNAGVKDVRVLADHWTFVTADGMPSAHFEHTLALTRTAPQILTAAPDGTGWAIN